MLELSVSLFLKLLFRIATLQVDPKAMQWADKCIPSGKPLLISYRENLTAEIKIYAKILYLNLVDRLPCAQVGVVHNG